MACNTALVNDLLTKLSTCGPSIDCKECREFLTRDLALDDEPLV